MYLLDSVFLKVMFFNFSFITVALSFLGFPLRRKEPEAIRGASSTALSSFSDSHSEEFNAQRAGTV